MSVFVAKSEPGGSAGHEWLIGGEAGAIELDERTAYSLTSQFPKIFTTVENPAKKSEAKAEEVVKTDQDSAEVIEEVKPAKKRTVAPKE